MVEVCVFRQELEEVVNVLGGYFLLLVVVLVLHEESDELVEVRGFQLLHVFVELDPVVELDLEVVQVDDVAVRVVL